MAPGSAICTYWRGTVAHPNSAMARLTANARHGGPRWRETQEIKKVMSFVCGVQGVTPDVR